MNSNYVLYENHIDDHSKKVKGKLNTKVLLDPEFEKFWNNINTRTIYSVQYSTKELIGKATQAISKMDNDSAIL